MIEGSGSKDFRKAKQLMLDKPEAMHLLLDKLATTVAAYLNGQIRSGAQAVQIFDTWGGLLTTSGYEEFSLGYMRKIIQQLVPDADGNKVPVIVFTKGGGLWLETMADSGADCLGL